jgi:AcrR family transcriptional regulator
VQAVTADGKRLAQSEAAAASGRERILAVARAAFIERGFSDVSMQEIATAAGLTKAAIYYHFPDKEALFTSVVASEFERLCRGVTAELALGPPLRDQLERVARFAFSSGRGDFGRLLGDAHQYCSHVGLKVIREQADVPMQLVRDAFVQARNAGEIADVNIDITVSLFFSMIAGQIKQANMGAQPDVTPEELACAVASLVLDGIGARRSG